MSDEETTGDAPEVQAQAPRTLVEPKGPFRSSSEMILRFFLENPGATSAESFPVLERMGVAQTSVYSFLAQLLKREILVATPVPNPNPAKNAPKKLFSYRVAPGITLDDKGRIKGGRPPSTIPKREKKPKDKPTATREEHPTAEAPRVPFAELQTAKLRELQEQRASLESEIQSKQREAEDAAPRLTPGPEASQHLEAARPKHNWTLRSRPEADLGTDEGAARAEAERASRSAWQEESRNIAEQVYKNFTFQREEPKREGEMTLGALIDKAIGDHIRALLDERMKDMETRVVGAVAKAFRMAREENPDLPLPVLKVPGAEPERERPPKVVIVNALPEQFNSVKRAFPELDLRHVRDRIPGEQDADLVVVLTRFIEQGLDKAIKKKFGDAYCPVNGAADAVKVAITARLNVKQHH